MFQPESLAANSFESSYNFKGAERFWTTELDHLPRCGWIVQRNGANFGDIAIRNPTDKACPRSIDPRLRILMVESESRAQPYFHEPTRLDNCEVQAFDSILDLLLSAT